MPYSLPEARLAFCFIQCAIKKPTATLLYLIHQKGQHH